MKINLKRIDDAYQMEATNELGNTIRMDGSPSIGGGNKSMSPMEAVIAALGGCSSIDVISILGKQRQPLENLEVEIEADREEGKVPSLFTEIRVHFKMYGDIKDAKAKQAVDLSMEKYCSVAMLLQKTAKIVGTYEVIS